MSPKPTIVTLSRKRRRIYFQMLMVIFVVAAPILFLYAAGYRFESIAGLVQTGGIYVGAEQSDAEIYLNGGLVHETGTFRRAFFIQHLKEGTYDITVSKEGYHPWSKTLPVYERIVTEAQAFNIPIEPDLILIPSTFTNQTINATTTKIIPNPVYEEAMTFFATSTATTTSKTITTPPSRANAVVATSTTERVTSTKEFRGMQLSAEGKYVVARWTRTVDTLPFYFCTQETDCEEEIILNTKGEKPLSFDFFPGTTDLVLISLKDGVYVTELDNRSGQNIQPLLLATDADFRVIDGGIYAKVGNRIYKVEI